MLNHDVNPNTTPKPCATGSRKGVWTDVDIPLDRFLLTWKGRLVEVLVLMSMESETKI